MPELAKTVRTTPHSGIRAMAELARKIPDVTHLEVGDPDFITPQHIIDAAAAAATEGFTHYPPSAGYPRLRELIAEKVSRRNHLPTTADQVVVTTGGGGGLFTTFLALLDPGDEVLIADPGWSGYPAQLHVQNAVSRRYSLDRTRDFALDPDALERAITPNTKVIVVNSPSNPLGGVYGREELRRVVEIAAQRDLWIVSDECYDEMVFEGQHVTMATLGERDRIITVFTFSKSYAMTGWRIGYVVAPAPVAAVIGKLQEPVVASASSVSQKAAEAALLGPQEIVGRMRDSYRARRDLALALLDAAGVGYVRPKGAFYLMVDTSPAGPSMEFAQRLLVEDKVATVPGSAFGPGGEGMVRVSLATAPDVLEGGLTRLAAMVKRKPTRATA
jgi:aspartate/methionine/tyrosine aminotransferase